MGGVIRCLRRSGEYEPEGYVLPAASITSRIFCSTVWRAEPPETCSWK